MRTPTMTTEQAESALGPRGNITIGSDNIATFHKWLTSRGIGGVYAQRCPRWLANKVYNDTTDAEFTRYKAGYESHAASKDKPADSPAPTLPAIEPATETAIPTPVATPTATNDAGKALADLVSPYIAATVLRDVHAAIDKRLENVQITRIEIVRTDGTTHNVEGHAHPKLKNLIRAMSSRQANGMHPNILIVGPTGSGKTHAFHMACKALGIDCRTNGAVTMDYQLVGFKDAAGNYHSTALREAFGAPCGYLFDEIDSSDNSPLLCLAGALANCGHRFPDQFVERHPDSVIVAAGNTWGNGANTDFVGRNKLDAAILSRFPIRIFWDYDEDLETAICGNPKWAAWVQRARFKARQAGLKVIIDPRMTQAGAALIAQGATFEEAAEETYLANLSEDQRKMLAA